MFPSTAAVVLPFRGDYLDRDMGSAMEVMVDIGDGGNRVTLSFDMIGSQDINLHGQKPPIIFLHGVTSAKETWKYVIRPLAVATCRKAYAYDARNHGDSGWSDKFSYDIMQKDLLDFLDSHHIRKAVLIGHSMGGKVAMLFALKWPKRVEKLIIEDISPKPSHSNARIAVQRYLKLLNHALEQIPPDTSDLDEAKNIVNRFLQDSASEDNRSSRHGRSDGSVLPLYCDRNGKYKWKANLKVIEEKFFLQPVSYQVSGTFQGSTLILYGTKSPYKVSADRDYIRSFFPSTQFRAIEGATHQIHLEYEDIFVKEVVDFINES